MAAVQGKLADALPLYDQALAVTETDPALTDLGLLLLVNKAVTLCNLNRYDEALATAERARQLATRSAPRSGWPRRTASSASCSSRPGAGMTRWPRSRPCRPT